MPIEDYADEIESTFSVSFPMSFEASNYRVNLRNCWEELCSDDSAFNPVPYLLNSFERLGGRVQVSDFGIPTFPEFLQGMYDSKTKTIRLDAVDDLESSYSAFHHLLIRGLHHAYSSGSIDDSVVSAARWSLGEAHAMFSSRYSDPLEFAEKIIESYVEGLIPFSSSVLADGYSVAEEDRDTFVFSEELLGERLYAPIRAIARTYASLLPKGKTWGQIDEIVAKAIAKAPLERDGELVSYEPFILELLSISNSHGNGATPEKGFELRDFFLGSYLDRVTNLVYQHVEAPLRERLINNPDFLSTLMTAIGEARLMANEEAPYHLDNFHYHVDRESITNFTPMVRGTLVYHFEPRE